MVDKHVLDGSYAFDGSNDNGWFCDVTGSNCVGKSATKTGP